MNKYTYQYIYIYVYIYVYTHIHIYTYMYIYLCVSLSIFWFQMEDMRSSVHAVNHASANPTSIITDSHAAADAAGMYKGCENIMWCHFM